MNISDATYALKLKVSLRLATPLLLRSGYTGDFTDSTIERVPKLGDNDTDKLYINGYVWASLIRRCLGRINDGKAEDLGSYHRTNAEGKNDKGVSPLWCESTTASLHNTTATPGIRISREWGAAESTALFTDELAISGLLLSLKLTLFCLDKDEADSWCKRLLQAFWIVNSGIENIGGGWGYGYGRLNVDEILVAKLNLKDESDRGKLWGSVPSDSWKPAEPVEPAIAAGWTIIDVSAQITDGQLMAVKTGTCSIEDIPAGKLPDSFVFRRNRLDSSGKLITGPVIPGKALRQALLSVPLKRKWRSTGIETETAICLSTTHGKKQSDKDSCSCYRCRWFGSTDAAGIVAVTDAALLDGNSTEIINRVQLCEHSMQNMNLFSGEYLTRGQFKFQVIIDHARSERALELVNEVKTIFDEMKRGSAPNGWYRVGGTSTCTGQVTVIDYTIKGSN